MEHICLNRFFTSVQNDGLDTLCGYYLSIIDKICAICNNKKMQNEPIFKNRKITITPFFLRTTNDELRTGAATNEPKRSQFKKKETHK